MKIAMSLNGKYSIGILLTFVLLVASTLYSIPLINLFFNYKTLTADVFFYNRLSLWFVLILILIYNFFIEKNSFFVWKDKKYSFVFFSGAVIILYLICLFGGAFLNGIIIFFTKENPSRKLIQVISLFQKNYFLIFFVCLTAAVVEELLMRAYIQPRIEKIYNSPIMGILISAFLFGILHSPYGTIGQVIVPLFIGFIFALFYKKYSNIKILITCHFIFDFISIMMMNFIDFKNLTLIDL